MNDAPDGCPKIRDLSPWKVDAGSPRPVAKPGAKSAAVTPQARPWPEPVPLHAAPDVPPFPTELLPPWMRDWVSAQAAELQVPADLPALLALGVAAAGIARNVVVSPWPGWSKEPTNLFIFCGLTPGEKKSQCFRKALAPVMLLEKAAAERAEPLVAEAEGRKRVAAKRVEHLELKLAKADPGPDRDQLADDHRAARTEFEAVAVPVRPIYRVDDDTPEKLASELCAQGGRLLVASPEARGLENIVRDEKVNADVFLKGHAGDDLRTGRVGRGRESVDRPALTCLYTPQPSVLESLAESPELRSRGFWGRWFYSLPKSRVGYRDCSKPSPEVPESVRASYAAAVTRLWGTAVAGADEPVELEFNAAAADVLTAFRVWIEPELRPGGQLAQILDWANKLAGLAVRLAGVLHCADAAGLGQNPGPVIGPGVVTRAVELAKGYALPHALAAFDAMGTSEAVVAARLVWRWAAGRADPAAPVTRRDVLRAKPGKFPTVDDLQPVLDLLERHDYLRAVDAGVRPGPGRPASPGYEPNPKALTPVAAGK